MNEEEQLHAAFLALCEEWGVSLGGLYEDAAKELARRAVAAERERCAKVCEAAWGIDGSLSAAEFAARVRETPNVFSGCTQSAGMKG